MRIYSISLILVFFFIGANAQTQAPYGGLNTLQHNKGGNQDDSVTQLPLSYPKNWNNSDSTGRIWFDKIIGFLRIHTGKKRDTIVDKHYVDSSINAHGGPVNSVFNRTGNIVADDGDYAAFYQAIGNYALSTTTITPSSPLTGGGALTGNIGIGIQQASSSQPGYLSANDYNTFLAKQNALGYTPYRTGRVDSNIHDTANSVLDAVSAKYYPLSNPNGYTNNPGTVTSISFSPPLTGGAISANGTVNIPASTNSIDGYLTSSDHSIFSAKQAALLGTGYVKSIAGTISYDSTTYYPASNPNGYTTNIGTVTQVVAGTGLSGGTITTTGTVSMPNVGTAGTYGSATTVPQFTTDAQGRVTAVTAIPITAGGTELIIAQSGTPSAILSTGGFIETTLATIAIPAGLMNANGRLKIEVLWKFTGTAGGSRITVVRFGSTSGGTTGTMYGYGLNTPTTLSVQTITNIYNANSTSSQTGVGINNAGQGSAYLSSTVTPTTSTVATASISYINLNGEFTTLGDTIQIIGYTVTLINP